MASLVLDERKKLILYTVTHEYIQTGEPVGSISLLERYQFGISSATVRNELAVLEEMSYLKQPHTSAGRIPTEKAYRFYVDSLTETRGLTLAEKNAVERFYTNLNVGIDELMQKTSMLLSQLTRCVGLVFAPVVKKNSLKHIDLVPISFNKILIILITDTGWVIKRILEMQECFSSLELSQFERILNEKLTGLSLETLINEPPAIDSLTTSSNNLLISIFKEVINSLEEEKEKGFYSNRAFDYYCQSGVATSNQFETLIKSLEEKYFLINFVKEVLEEGQIIIKIGSENEYLRTEKLSLVASSYWVHEGTPGAVGILGPLRMDYNRAISAVSYVAARLNSLFKSYRSS